MGKPSPTLSPPRRWSVSDKIGFAPHTGLHHEYSPSALATCAPQFRSLVMDRAELATEP